MPVIARHLKYEAGTFNCNEGAFASHEDCTSHIERAINLGGLISSMAVTAVIAGDKEEPVESVERSKLLLYLKDVSQHMDCEFDEIILQGGKIEEIYIRKLT